MEYVTALIAILTLMAVITIALLGALWGRINSLYDNYNGFKEYVGREYMPRDECQQLVTKEITDLKEKIKDLDAMTREMYKIITHKESS